MSEPFLILHKVRGQPAFDIAILCEDMGTGTDPGPWWIIPTSGHRAHPHMKWELFDLANFIHPMKVPEDLPDHCQYDLDRSTGSIASTDVQKALASLIKPQAPMVRRKL